MYLHAAFRIFCSQQYVNAKHREIFWSLFISISRQGIFYIPLLYLLSNFYGELGIYLLQPVSDVFSFLLAVFIVHRNNKYVSIKLGEKGREEL